MATVTGTVVAAVMGVAVAALAAATLITALATSGHTNPTGHPSNAHSAAATPATAATAATVATGSAAMATPPATLATSTAMSVATRAILSAATAPVAITSAPEMVATVGSAWPQVGRPVAARPGMTGPLTTHAERPAPIPAPVPVPAQAPAPDPGQRCAPAPAPPPTPTPAPAPRPEQPDEGWLAHIWNAASEWFADQVILPGVDPLLRLLGGTVLAAPDPSCMPGMVDVWSTTRTIAVGLYGLLVLGGALLVMAQGTLQARYGVRELLPRIVLGFAGANLSLWIIGQAVAAANALTTAVLGEANSQATATGLRDLIVNSESQQGGLWLIFVVAAFLVVVVFIVIGYVQRLALLAIVTIAAPLALACHALPGLDGLAKWWWRALAAVLGAQFAQALTFVVALRVFLAPGALGSSGGFAEPAMRLFLALGVVLIMAMVPIHVMRAARIGHGGSLIGTVTRTVLAVKTLGMLRATRATRATAATAGRRPPRASGRPSRPRTTLSRRAGWPFGSGTAPAGRSLAEARRAQREATPSPPRPRPNRLHPPQRPPNKRPEPVQANRLYPPPPHQWTSPPQRRSAPRTPPAGPASGTRRRSISGTGRVDPPRASRHTTPPTLHPRTPPRTPPPQRRTYQPRRQP